MAGLVEQGVEVVDLAFLVELGNAGSRVLRMASTILCLRMPVSQVLTLDRPENPAAPCSAATSVSWTTSSARSVSRSCSIATRSR